MDQLLLISIAFLSTIFCIIGGFVVKLYLDERNLRNNRRVPDGVKNAGSNTTSATRVEAHLERDGSIDEVDASSENGSKI